MGNTCSGAPAYVVICYQGQEIECFECPISSLRSARLLAEFVRSELLHRDKLDRSASIRVYWTATGLEVADSDLKDLRPLRKRGLFVNAERSAESDAARDNYRLEEQASESFLHMLIEEAQRIREEGFGAVHTKEAASPEFGRHSFEDLVDTLRRAGAATASDALMNQVWSVMRENLRLLNKAAILAQHAFEQFPAVVRGLTSKDSTYVASATVSLQQHVEGISVIVDEATDSMERLREYLHARQYDYKVGADARVCANTAGITVCAVVPTADALVTKVALAEGADAAARSPFTSWLTSQHVHMHYWNSPGGLFSGSQVHSAASLVYHFHVLSFVTSGGVALAGIGGLVALLHYRWRRIGSWRQAAEMVTPATDSLKAHEDYWCGLRFPCDQIAKALPQASGERTTTSFHAINAWRKVLKDTAMLITAINAYFVWLDLAGWVPANFPLRSRLQQLNSRDPYGMMVQMIQSPPRQRHSLPPRQRNEAPALLPIQAAEMAAHYGHQPDQIVDALPSGPPSEQAAEWFEEEHPEEEDWCDEQQSEECEENEEADVAEQGEHPTNPFDEHSESANAFDENPFDDDELEDVDDGPELEEEPHQDASGSEADRVAESCEVPTPPLTRAPAGDDCWAPGGNAGSAAAVPLAHLAATKKYDPVHGGLEPHRRHASLAASERARVASTPLH